jgi:hypothetical protein
MSCPYSTYQRALASKNLSIAEAINNPGTFNLALLGRLSAKAKKDPEFVEAFFKEAHQHLKNDFEIMVQFRL